MRMGRERTEPEYLVLLEEARKAYRAVTGQEPPDGK